MSALLLLGFAAPAHADPRALARTAGVLAVAPGGDQVLVAQARGTNLRVVSIPLAGGAARPVFSFDSPNGLVPVSASLSASAQRAALILEMGPDPREPEAVQTFAGPLAGGWVTLQPLTRLSSPGAVRPVRQQADGDRLFTTEYQGEGTRVVVRDPDPREVAFTEGESEYAARFAGDLVATSVVGEESSRLVVRDWRTGVFTTSTEIPDGISFLALRPDGHAAALTFDGALYEASPGGPARRLASDGGSAMAYAGDALVHDPGGQLRAIDLGGRPRAFGVPTETLEGFATEGSQVVWIANGCLLADDVGAPAAAAPGPGPCVRAELTLDGHEPDLYLTRRLPVALHCVAAPKACRGKLRLGIGLPYETKPIGGRVPFLIPAGEARSVRVALTCRGYRMMLRELRREARAVVTVDARTDDGQRFPVYLWFEVPSGPADPSRRCGEPPPPNPTGLSASIDIGPLRGKSVPGTPCRVRRKLQYGNPGDHEVGVRLTCTAPDDLRRLGFVGVERVQSGQELPEDTLRCTAEIDRDGEATGLHSCDLWHGRITLHVAALCVHRCNAAKHARAKTAARATINKLAKWLATMPERPCRLCTK